MHFARLVSEGTFLKERINSDFNNTDDERVNNKIPTPHCTVRGGYRHNSLNDITEDKSVLFARRYFKSSEYFSTALLAHASSLSPPGAPETPIPPKT